MAIGVLGGTFNPPHNGHILAARQVWDALSVEKILFVPTNLPPHKNMSVYEPTAEQRLFMTQLAVQNLDFLCVSDVEIKRGGISYTVDTLKEILNVFMDKVYLIVGTDMLLGIEKWYKFREIFSLCTICTVARNKRDYDAITKHILYLRSNYGADVVLIKGNPVDISSTYIRNVKDYNIMSKFVPPKVLEYIISNNIYL